MKVYLTLMGVSTIGVLLAATAFSYYQYVFSDVNLEGLAPPEPIQIFWSEGGSVEVWNSDFSVVRGVFVNAARITLQPRGLRVLEYSDSAQLAYILEGRAKMGLAFAREPRANVRSVSQGDVIAIPGGVGQWWYNDGDKSVIVLLVADTSRGPNPAEYKSFYMSGGTGSEWGQSIFHGFDEDLLLQAWDVDEDIVSQVIEGQKGTAIIKVADDFEMRLEAERNEESEDKFTYNIDDARPDVTVDNGGTFSLLTSQKLSILREVRLAAIRVKLNSGALFGPAYIINGHMVVYVTKGSGRIQISGPNDQLLDTNVKQGSLVVVPQFHPGIKAASDECFEFLVITTSDWPIFSFLAGKNSIYRGVPVELQAASNNVSIEVEQTVLDRRQNNSVIFPSRSKSDGASGMDSNCKKLKFYCLFLLFVFLY